MTEKLLQFIWRFQYFNRHELTTDEGDALQIIKPGTFNNNQGPDFSEAAVKIASVKLFGNIELHVRSSDWHKHNHASDKNYSNIILHVVWEDDRNKKNKIALPTLSLQNRVPKILLQRYEQLMNEGYVLHCKNFLPVLSNIGWISWKERLMAERLEIKSEKVFLLLQETNYHWEEVFWQMIAANFGIKVNTALFEAVAKSISINILSKHKNQIHQLEAMLLGQANLLDQNFREDYPQLLKREFQFLKKKYILTKVNAAAHFLRMRPANFPTLRLAQLAMLIHKSSHLFSKIKEMNKAEEVRSLFKVTCNDYWHYHFLFDEETNYQPKHLGNQMIDNIMINTVIPLLFSYGLYHKEQLYKDKAMGWLTEIKAEENSITRTWKSLQIENKNALDSQALIHLNNNYCQNKRCLECAVGNKILKPTN